MSPVDETYGEVANQALEELRDEFGPVKTEHKKMSIYT